MDNGFVRNVQFLIKQNTMMNVSRLCTINVHDLLKEKFEIRFILDMLFMNPLRFFTVFGLKLHCLLQCSVLWVIRGLTYSYLGSLLGVQDYKKVKFLMFSIVTNGT